MPIVYAMYDPKSQQDQAWEVPVPYAGAYDVQFDDVKYAWGADMSTDLVQRLNVETGRMDALISCRFHQYAPYRRAEELRPERASPACGPKASRTGKIVHIEPLDTVTKLFMT